MVVDAKAKETDERENSLEWIWKCVQKDLTEPTLLEISGKRVYQDLDGNELLSAL